MEAKRVFFSILSLLFASAGIGTTHAAAFVTPSSTRSGIATATRRFAILFASVGSETDIAPSLRQDRSACTSDFMEIFIKDTPLLDIRADVEFSKGSFPNSVSNIPLLDNEQRRLIGICYKEKGQEAAINLGQKSITPELKAQRIEEWKKHVVAHPEGYLYCFRGGLRSKITQQWLQEAGLGEYPYVEGGYKAMRHFLMEDLEESVNALPLVMIGGHTGSGKTHLLETLPRHVDLEGLAKHRGSSFGGLVETQPTQINFENALSVEFLKLRHEGGLLPVFIEEEGRRIGRRTLPQSMHTRMMESYPVVILETPMEERVEICVRDYITDAFPAFQLEYAERAHGLFREEILANLGRIKKRLGGDRHKAMHAQLVEAFGIFEQEGVATGFNAPIEILLRQYYDPMYEYQSTERKGKVLFRGDADAIRKWAANYAV